MLAAGPTPIRGDLPILRSLPVIAGVPIIDSACFSDRSFVEITASLSVAIEGDDVQFQFVPSVDSLLVDVFAVKSGCISFLIAGNSIIGVLITDLDPSLRDTLW